MERHLVFPLGTDWTWAEGSLLLPGASVAACMSTCRNGAMGLQEDARGGRDGLATFPDPLFSQLELAAGMWSRPRNTQTLGPGGPLARLPQRLI